MDASQLRSEIYRLERECSELASENAEMQREIGAICSSARSATNNLVRTQETAKNLLDKSANVVEYADQTLNAVIAEQDHISLLYQGFGHIETANKKIRELNDKIYYEFANFRMVRKIVRAFVDNINLDMVKPELIYKSIEKEHLQSPDFWLSCAMLAIMHWRDDEKEAAARALDKALELDDRQTMLFFMSFNLLLGRRDAALKWFECYRRAEKTGNDASFALLLLHATNLREDEQDELTVRIKEYLFEEFERSKSMNDWDELVEYVKDHLVQFNSSEKIVFNNLRNYVKDYSVMANTIAMARDNSAILEFISSLNTVSRGKGYIYIEKFISEILDTPDKKERAYTDEIAYNEMIIKCVGDYGLAEEEYKKVYQHETSPLNLMLECVNWLFSSSDAEVSEVARCNMFLLCRELISDAVKKYTAEYRAQVKSVHPVAIKDYATQMNFNNKDAEVRKVNEFYNRKRDSQLATVKNTTMIMCIVFAALLFVGGIACLICNGMVEGGILLILMGVCFVATVVLVIMAIANYFGNKRRIREIIKNNEVALANVLAIVDKLFAEYAEYQKLYVEFDRVVDDILYAVER